MEKSKFVWVGHGDCHEWQTSNPRVKYTMGIHSHYLSSFWAGVTIDDKWISFGAVGANTKDGVYETEKFCENHFNNLKLE